MMDMERTNMILARLRQLWITIQATNPDQPYPVSEVPRSVQVVMRAASRKTAMAEFQPLFNELMGGERVAAINAGPINWGD